MKDTFRKSSVNSTLGIIAVIIAIVCFILGLMMGRIIWQVLMILVFLPMLFGPKEILIFNDEDLCFRPNGSAGAEFKVRYSDIADMEISEKRITLQCKDGIKPKKLAFPRWSFDKTDWPDLIERCHSLKKIL